MLVLGDHRYQLVRCGQIFGRVDVAQSHKVLVSIACQNLQERYHARSGKGQMITVVEHANFGGGLLRIAHFSRLVTDHAFIPFLHA